MKKNSSLIINIEQNMQSKGNVSLFSNCESFQSQYVTAWDNNEYYNVLVLTKYLTKREGFGFGSLINF